MRVYSGPPRTKKRIFPTYSPEQWNQLFEQAMATPGGITHASLTDDGLKVIVDPDITSIQ